MPWHRALLRVAAGLALVTCIGCGSNLTPTKPGGWRPVGSGGASGPGSGGASGLGGAGGNVCPDPTHCSPDQAKWDVSGWDTSVWN